MPFRDDPAAMNRLFYLALFAVCAGLLGFGLYLEHVKNLEPCPLCVFQRVAFVAVMLLALLAAVHNPRNLMRPVYAALLIGAGLAGAGIAARQLWLQHLPPELAPACGPGLEYMLSAFPFMEALQMILSGSGECAEVQWAFLGLSIPAWSLAWFVIIVIATWIAALRFKPR